ncbi:MAG: glutamate synthase subunit alpha, partial [Proteobacteria bacterium]|nr:glutamate synthase subunit alpha [Pseudomonadota bacterium]
MEKFEQAWLDDPRMMQRDACGVGFIASIKGQKSHKTLTEGLDILCRMDHRGGRAADDLTSDGAGILTQIPHELFRAAAFLQEKHLPEPGAYAVAQFFLPKNKLEQNHWDERIDALAKDQGVAILLCRPVPVDPSVLGPVAKANEPETLQWIFTDRQADSKKSFTWRLYMLRKLLEEEARQRYGIKQLDFYCVSLSTETICYKGLILAKDLANYYQDLQNPLFSSAFAMVHQRFSTNTHPAWPLAQPFRTICHNGEINTLRGNMNAMHARSRLFQKDGIDDDLARIGPICTPGLSDSAMLDNSIEFMVNAGRPLHQVLSMVIPEPWDANAEMNQDLKDYYEYHSYMMEPWDGPAFIGFADGQKIGAILDRNGLRPGRYWVTADDYVIMASETGVLNRRPKDIVLKGRLSPGRMFLVDMQKATIVPDHSIKQSLAHEKPYGQWLQHQRRHLNDLPLPSTPLEAWNDSISLLQRQQLFGYSKEDLRLILAPMANEGKEPVGSMGNDTPIAVLSKQRPLLYNYFK